MLTRPYAVEVPYLVLVPLGVPRLAWSQVGLREARRPAPGVSRAALGRSRRVNGPGWRGLAPVLQPMLLVGVELLQHSHRVRTHAPRTEDHGRTASHCRQRREVVWLPPSSEVVVSSLAQYSMRAPALTGFIPGARTDTVAVAPRWQREEIVS